MYLSPSSDSHCSIPNLLSLREGGMKARNGNKQMSVFASHNNVLICWWNKAEEQWFTKWDDGLTPPLHLTDVLFHQASVEVNKESPGGLGTLSEAIDNSFMDVRVCGILFESIREVWWGLLQDCDGGGLETWGTPTSRQGLREHWFCVYLA